MNNRKIIIGTRGSKLALWQANYVKVILEKLKLDSEIKIIRTKGDKIQNLSFEKIEGKGFFTKEIEEELLNKSIDLAVHSLKDLETKQPVGLKIAAVPSREDPSDTLIIDKKFIDPTKPLHLAVNAVVGTSSARRKNQLLFFRDDLNILSLRGNVPTRIKKLENGDYNAIVLAKAGLNRLKIDLSNFFVFDLSPSIFIPAPAQGALGIQVRENDNELTDILSNVSDEESLKNVSFEREVLKKSGGGCHSPLGVFSFIGLDGKRNTWVSSAENIQSTPIRFFTSSDDSDSIAEKLKNNKNKKKIWISRRLDQGSLFKKLLNPLNCIIEDLPLIEKTTVMLDELPFCNWIFFNSAFSFDSILHLNEQTKNKKIAAFGNSTANYLKKNGFIPDFTGNGDPDSVSKDFLKTIKDDEIVFFPTSNISLGSVQKKLPNKNKVVKVTYNTIFKEIKLKQYDYLVFTSPSNVKAFNTKNSVGNKIAISIGPSTSKALRSAAVSSVFQSYEPTELSLAETVISLL